MYESLQEMWLIARRNPVTLLGFAVLLAIALIAAFVPLIAPYSPNYTDAANALQPPSLHHRFGTGIFGEDIFSRVLYGSRYDLGIALGAVGIGFTCGSAVGAIAGYIGGAPRRGPLRVMGMGGAFPP